MPIPMRPTPDRMLTRSEDLGPRAIWFAFLGPPLAWIAHFLSIYGFASVACDGVSTSLLYVTTIVAAPVTIAAGVIAWRLMQQPVDQGNDAPLQTDQRTRALGRAGLVLSVIFLVAILMEGAAPLFFDPCGGIT